MKQALLVAALFVSLYFPVQSFAQGQLVVRRFTAPSLEGNRAGEPAERRVSIYLPPGYSHSGHAYPVLYYLHGYSFSDSSTVAWLDLVHLMDTAIAAGLVRPMIVVIPDNYTRYGGSWYTNSSFTGHWADYVAKDVVNYVDRHFRTLSNRDSRCVAGVSMGGNGALRMGMLFPETFGSVYASSAAILDWSEGINPAIPAFREIARAQTEKDIDEGSRAWIMADVARTWSPDASRPPFYADMPATYMGDSLVTDTAVVRKWEANLPFHMIDDHVAALKSLRALKMDWGRNDENQFNPATNLAFSQKLEHLGVRHFAEAYLGGHADRIPGTAGRFYTEVLPFCNTYLRF
jgi:S-formylglutathione hydrolase FrmB